MTNVNKAHNCYPLLGCGYLSSFAIGNYQFTMNKIKSAVISEKLVSFGSNLLSIHLDLYPKCAFL